MRPSIISEIQQLFKNIILNATGAERTLHEYLEDGDVSHALQLMTSNAIDVGNAISEYNPYSHEIMSRKNKYPKGKEPYITCKLPRCRQKYINEIELFFLLGKPIVWHKDEGGDDAFKLFTDFIKDHRFDSSMRKVKRIAGSETECAKLYRLYKDGSKPICDIVILSRSNGYDLRILKDQYGKLLAFAYGYTIRKTDNKSESHWVFLTESMTYECTKSALGWAIERYPNPTGKINLIYYKQHKAWEGVEPRLSREEELDSKIGDTNNYFADPIAKATADVIDSMYDPMASAKLIQLTGKDSSFEYVQPPQASELRRDEKRELADSILFDTFTPDFSFEKLKGLGSVSGVAIKNAMALGYIKRANLMEDYGELVDREKNVIIAVLKFLNPTMASELDKLRVSFDFAEPFDDDAQANWNAISQLYSNGLISLEEAVVQIGICDTPEAEIKRIKDAEDASASRSKEQNQNQIGFLKQDKEEQ